MRTLKTGDSFQHYVVGRLLGEGFHGRVHEIVHPHTGDRFALKTMQLAHVGNARAVRRALAEAKGTYGIDHTNVIKVFDLNCEDDGFVWMRTEMLEGETITELLARVGYLSPLFAISVAIEAAHGLQAAHEAQVIHRDVKPANLFHVRPTRAIKVIDFSIAKFFAERFETTVGQAGLGTAAYMCPEQLEGMVPTPAFDVYALGMTLWQMLVGRHPFHEVLNHSREIFHKQFSEMPPLLADVMRLPREVDRVVRRSLAKDPADRFHTMREMAQALIDLRASLEREAASGRIFLRVAPGEPPVPGDARTRRDYTPPAAIPRSEQPTPAPAGRIVVPALNGANGDDDGRHLAKTTPLDSAPGLGGTIPLTAGPMPSRAAALAASSSVYASPATPTEVTRSPIHAAPRRVPWAVVSGAVVVVGVVSAAAVWRLGAQRSHDVAPPTTASARPEIAPIAIAATTPEPMETASSAATSGPVQAAASSLPVHAAPKLPRRAAPMPEPAPLPPPARPSASPRAPSRTFDVDN